MDNNQKKQLPLFEDQSVLPTGKHHTSFSELNDFVECPYRHYLKHVKKIDWDEPSIHTEYGSVIHDALEQFLLSGKGFDEQNKQHYVSQFEKRLGKLLFLNSAVTAEDAEEFRESISDILDKVPVWFNKKFPGWKLISAEDQLFETVPTHKDNKYFKGYVDAIIKTTKYRKKKGTKQQIGEQYWLLDWKSCEKYWPPQKERDFYKQMQLILYKYFFCERMNIPYKDVKCGFILIRRNIPKKEGSDKSRSKLVEVSAGEKRINKTLTYLQDFLNQMDMGLYHKNRQNCRFCPFQHTEYCV